MSEMRQSKLDQNFHFLTIMDNNQKLLSTNPTKFRRSACSLNSLNIKKRESRIFDNPSVSQLKNKKQTIKYEIQDNNKIVICSPSGCSYSYKFDKVIQQKQFMVRTAQAILKNQKSKKIIICDNYSASKRIDLMKVLCKKLIKSNVKYTILSNFKMLQEQQVIKKKNKLLFQAQDTNQYHKKYDLKRIINFQTDANNFENELSNNNLFIQDFQIQNNIIEYVIVFVNDLSKQINSKLKNVLKFYQKQLFSDDKKNQVFQIYISSLWYKESNASSLRLYLEKTIDLREEIKELFFSIRRNKILKNENFLTTHQNINTQNFKETRVKVQQNEKSKLPRKSNYINCQKTRKNSKIDFLMLNQDYQNTQKNQYINNYRKISLNSEQNLQNIKQFDLEQNKENKKYNLMTENKNLKYQLCNLQQEYKNQSQKYINKMNRKIQHLNTQKIGYINEIKILKQQNVELQKQVVKLRFLYQEAIFQKDQVFIFMQKQKAIQANLKNKILELKQEIKNKSQLHKNLQKRVEQLKGYLQDSRLRYKNHISQLKEQIQGYKKFSQQIKIAYDRIQTQMRMENNRCQNLQRRCKKYQQSIANLAKIQPYHFQIKKSQKIKNINTQMSIDENEKSNENYVPQIGQLQEKSVKKQIYKLIDSLTKNQQKYAITNQKTNNIN